MKTRHHETYTLIDSRCADAFFPPRSRREDPSLDELLSALICDPNEAGEAESGFIPPHSYDDFYARGLPSVCSAFDTIMVWAQRRPLSRWFSEVAWWHLPSAAWALSDVFLCDIDVASAASGIDGLTGLTRHARELVSICMSWAAKPDQSLLGVDAQYASRVLEHAVARHKDPRLPPTTELLSDIAALRLFEMVRDNHQPKEEDFDKRADRAFDASAAAYHEARGSREHYASMFNTAKMLPSEMATKTLTILVSQALLRYPIG